MDTEFYVDPSLNSDTGAGTIGDPYGDLEYCLEQEDWVTGGVRVNIKAGTAEFPAVEISTAMADTSAPGKSVAWAPAIASPLVFEGYTTLAGDGGIAEIDCGGNKSFYSNSTLDYVHFKYLNPHNFGNNIGIVCDNQCSMINCVMSDSGNTILFDCDDQGVVFGNYFTEFGTNAIRTGSYPYIAFNYAKSGVLQPGSVAIAAGQGATIYRNIVSVRGLCNGIYAGNFGVVNQNAVYSDGGTVVGINGLSASVFSIINNRVQGFSGAGGVGIDTDGATNHARLQGGNKVYDCTTEFIAQDTYTIFDLGGDEIATSSLFTDPANGDFSPLNGGLVSGLSVPANFANGNI